MFPFLAKMQLANAVTTNRRLLITTYLTTIPLSDRSLFKRALTPIMPPLSQSLKSKIKHAFTSSAQHSNVDIQTATMAKLYSALQQTSWTAHATMGKSAIVLARDRKLAGTPKLYLVDIEVYI